MLAIKGIYNGKYIIPLGEIPHTVNKDVIITFLDDTDEKEINIVREMTSNSNAFEFWESEEEDIYQDYLSIKK